MKDGIIALEVHQVITFVRPRTAEEIDDLEDAIVAVCCGPGHSTDPTGVIGCDPDVTVGGGFDHHYTTDADATDWGGEYEPDAAILTDASF